MANVKGMPDSSPEDVLLRESCINILKKKFQVWGGLPIDTSIVEYSKGVEKMYGEGFAKEVFIVKPRNLSNDDVDKNEKEMILRYDLTLPFARYAGDKCLDVFRRYQIGRVYRKDTPNVSQGRFREFYQADFDIIGTDNKTMGQEGEVLSLLVSSLKKLINVPFKIRINDKNVLLSLLEKCGIPNNKIYDTTVCLDKLDKKSWSEIKKEMNEEKEIDKKIVDKLYEEFSKFQMEKDIDGVTSKLIGLLSSDLTTNLIKLSLIIKELGLKDYIEYDICLARGLDYYTGLLFEVVLDDKTLIKTTIASGGRYDKVIEKFSSKKNIPAIGVSFGLERIIYIKKNLKEKVNLPKITVYVASVGKGLFVFRQQLVNKFREENISSITSYSNNPKMKKQLDYVLENEIPYMIVIGNSEVEKGTMQLKTIKTKVQEELKFEEVLNKVKSL